MAKAGFCEGCRTNVWLHEDGSCPHGHPASHITGHYEAEAPVTAPVTRRPVWPWVVGGIVAVLAIGLIAFGALASIAAPVFMNASANAAKQSCYANERTIVGASQVYLLEHDGAKLPTDWNGLMAVLVPAELKSEPVCPSGGTYSITVSGNTVKVTCSVHGTFPASPGNP